MDDINNQTLLDVESLIAGKVPSPFYKGMDREKLVAMLGEPDAISTISRKTGGPGIFRFGSIEFHFDNEPEGGLCLIHFDVFGPVVGSSRLRVVSGVYSPGFRLSAAIEFFAEQGVACEVTSDALGFHTIHVGASVDLIFEEHDQDKAGSELVEVSIRPVGDRLCD